MNFRGEVLVADVPNKNNRIYPKHLLEEIVAKFQDVIKNRGLIGQMGYPGDSMIHFAEASHIVTDLAMEDNKMVAEIETIQTPCGKELEKLLKGDAKIALRPYGVGNGKVNEDGVLVIDDSYKMISISVVDAEKAS